MSRAAKIASVSAGGCALLGYALQQSKSDGRFGSHQTINQGAALPGVFCLADAEKAAKKVLPKVVWGYYCGGADGEVTLRRFAIIFEYRNALVK